MTDSHSFNLVDQPWIKAIDLEGQSRLLSLREIFAQSENLSVISGDLPTQDFAIARLLLAIVHRAVDGPSNSVTWLNLWRDTSGSVLEHVDAYLDTWHHRFDLFDQTAPFYQVSDLRPMNSAIQGDLVKIVADIPDNFPLFASRRGKALASLTPAEAARWLVHMQAYDTAGIKTGMVGDVRVKSGKGYSIGTGWCGELGGVLIEGDNLLRTLLLNLTPSLHVPYDPDDDEPVWERPALTSAPEGYIAGKIDARPPRGKVDVYTWQSRRVRLVTNAQGDVVNALVGQGDKIPPQNLHEYEPMSGWRHSKPQTQKAGKNVYMPAHHDSARRLWQGLQTIVLNDRVPEGSKQGFQAANLHFLNEVRHLIDMNGLLRIKAYGMDYGTQSATFDNYFVDALVAPVDVFTDMEAGNQVIDASTLAYEASRAYGNLAQNLAYAAGQIPPSKVLDREKEGIRIKAREEAFALLEPVFKQWITTLADSPSDALQRWRDTARPILLHLGETCVQAAGVPAILGRVIKSGEGDDSLINAAIAQRWFNAKIHDVLPPRSANE